ncbi:2-dehydro-3-deoxygalactonokinase [Roseovarius faecimaris]|uniref:2-dehydro-3-deoxygalactonokinase n=1 Tax=Roseovarius faecimaris TaxID=2494550 RepID=A0A6I6IWE4_9RHOB|nr:2-dehydro-3-deoxygalactonokinase [Roseovarius faecimaris]QGX97008.1 2-dehydro-3-deoxygalactonokinase [Roseovarius faecimaris]
MTDWVALGREAGAFLGYLVRDGAVDGPARAASEAEVLRALGAEGAPLRRIGEGTATRLPARIIPQTAGDLSVLEQETPPDVISAWVRLWVIGLRAERPNWDGVICAFQGDVVHWLHVSADEIVSSQSSLTPRLATALDVSGAAPDPEAVAEGLSRPERLAQWMRTAEVTGRADCALGALIGAELAAMRAYWLGQQVMVIGDSPLVPGYAAALQVQGVPCERSAPAQWITPGLLALAAVG